MSLKLEHLFKPMTDEQRAEQAERHKQWVKDRVDAFQLVKNMGATVIDPNHTHCLDCGAIVYMARLGCACWDMTRLSDPTYKVKGIEYGSLVLESINDKGVHRSNGFISNQDLHQKLQNGERFFRSHLEKVIEVTLDDFKGGE